MASRHLLPLSSVIFRDQQSRSPTPRLWSRRGQTPTLVNLQDAMDLSVTALPALPSATVTVTTTATKEEPEKNSIWKRVCATVNRWLRLVRESAERRTNRTNRTNEDEEKVSQNV